MLQAEKTNRQLLAERDFVRALIVCLRECAPAGQAPIVPLESCFRIRTVPDGKRFPEQPGHDPALCSSSLGKVVEGPGKLS